MFAVFLIPGCLITVTSAADVVQLQLPPTETHHLVMKNSVTVRGKCDTTQLHSGHITKVLLQAPSTDTMMFWYRVLSPNNFKDTQLNFTLNDEKSISVYSAPRSGSLPSSSVLISWRSLRQCRSETNFNILFTAYWPSCPAQFSNGFTCYSSGVGTQLPCIAKSLADDGDNNCLKGEDESSPVERTYPADAGRGGGMTPYQFLTPSLIAPAVGVLLVGVVFGFLIRNRLFGDILFCRRPSTSELRYLGGGPERPSSLESAFRSRSSTTSSFNFSKTLEKSPPSYDDAVKLPTSLETAVVVENKVSASVSDSPMNVHVTNEEAMNIHVRADSEPMRLTPLQLLWHASPAQRLATESSLDSRHDDNSLRHYDDTTPSDTEESPQIRLVKRRYSEKGRTAPNLVAVRTSTSSDQVRSDGGDDEEVQIRVVTNPEMTAADSSGANNNSSWV